MIHGYGILFPDMDACNYVLRRRKDDWIIYRQSRGFSLLETLVCMAIVAILAAMYLPALSKARRKAEEVGVISSMHQDHIAKMTGNHQGIRGPLPSQDGDLRGMCRAAYRQAMSDGSGAGTIYITELRFVVRNEAEFRAYWHTLINPAATEPLEFTNSGELIAQDEEGNTFYLGALRDEAAMMWEFLSTNLAETSSGTLGTTVRYADGHVEYKRYPYEFPACRSVAELSHRFMVEYGAGG